MEAVMKQQKTKVNSFQLIKELYGKSDLSNTVKPGHPPKGINPKETPQNQSRCDDHE